VLYTGGRVFKNESENIFIYVFYLCRINNTGCFTTLGHNCRRWFPRSLWWKRFI